jgi:small subunit ribosomal protein S18
LQKLVTAHGKIMSRRFTGATTKQQRDLTRAIKQAQFLALLPVGSTKRF